MKIVRNMNNSMKAKYVSSGEVVSYNHYCFICTGEYDKRTDKMEFVNLTTGAMIFFEGDCHVEVHPNAVLCLEGYPEEGEK